MKKKKCKESIEYILAYLNNRHVFNWLQFNGIVKGSIVEFSETPIASIPFRPINWDCEEEVQLHDDIKEHTRQFINDKDETHLTIIDKKFNQLLYV